MQSFCTIMPVMVKTPNLVQKLLKTYFQVLFIWETSPTAERSWKSWTKMIYGSSGLEKSLLSYSASKLIKKRFKMLTQQFWSIYGYEYLMQQLTRSMWFQGLFYQFYEFFFTSYFRFLNASNFLEIFPFSGIPVFEAAILAYKQKIRIF